MSPVARAVLLGLAFLLTILSGIWLSRTGRPLNVVVSTLHKLSGLAAGIYLLVTALQRNRLVALGPAAWALVAVAGACLVAMAATGALLSTDRALPAAVLRIHQIVPALASLSAAAGLALIF